MGNQKKALRVGNVILSDYAFTTEGGKLSVIGVFESIFADLLPTTHPEMFFVASFVGEANTNHKIKVEVLDPSGSNIFANNEEILIKLSDNGTGNLIHRLLNFPISTEGKYKISIYEGSKKINTTMLPVIKTNSPVGGLPN